MKMIRHRGCLVSALVLGLAATGAGCPDPEQVGPGAMEPLARPPGTEQVAQVAPATTPDSPEKIAYDRCLAEFDLDRWRVAYDCFRELPAESPFAAQAKDRMAECAEQLSRYHRAEGKAYEEAGRLFKAQEHYLAFLELHPCDAEIYTRLRAIEPRIEAPAGRERPRFAWDRAACGDPP